MKKTIYGLLAGVWLVSSVVVYAADMNSIAKASMILSTVAGLADKYQDVQEMLDRQTRVLELIARSAPLQPSQKCEIERISSMNGKNPNSTLTEIAMA